MRVVVAAAESGKAKAARRLRPEHSPNSLLQQQASRLSQAVHLVSGLFSGTFSTEASFFTVPRHRVCWVGGISGVRLCDERNRVETVCKSCPDAGTNIEPSGDEAKAATRVISFVPGAGTAGLLWFSPDWSPLY